MQKLCEILVIKIFKTIIYLKKKTRKKTTMNTHFIVNSLFGSCEVGFFSEKLYVFVITEHRPLIMCTIAVVFIFPFSLLCFVYDRLLSSMSPEHAKSQI